MVEIWIVDIPATKNADISCFINVSSLAYIFADKRIDSKSLESDLFLPCLRSFMIFYIKLSNLLILRADLLSLG